MSLTVQAIEYPKWEAKTRPKTTGVREYGIEVSAETFRKLLWVTKGRNAADKDSPDRITVSGLAETALREWLTKHHPLLDDYWQDYERAEMEAIDFVAEQSIAARTGGQPV